MTDTTLPAAATMPTVAGWCPMGCGQTLFLGAACLITCSATDCPNPTAASDLLADWEVEHVVILADGGQHTIRHPLAERFGDADLTCDLDAHIGRLSPAPRRPTPPAPPPPFSAPAATGSAASPPACPRGSGNASPTRGNSTRTDRHQPTRLRGHPVTVYHVDHDVTLHVGDTIEVMRGLPESSVDCVVTSPPYFGLRDYGHPGQYGLETSPAEYVARMVEVFAEVRRLLRPDGTCWVNIGDSYASTGGTSGVGPNAVVTQTKRQATKRTRPMSALQPKNLIGMPWRVAFGLQDDGWILRNAVVWNKPNAMPESVRDRLSTRYETVFLLTRSARYWFDLDAIREPLAHPETLDVTRVFGGKNKDGTGGTGASARRRGHNVYGSKHQPLTGGHGTMGQDGNGRRYPEKYDTGRGRNPGDVWTLSTQPYPEAHFAVMPPELARRCILAGCRPGGTVLDSFSGSGTTGMVARQTGRRYVGIDLRAEYHDLAVRRMGDTPLPFGEAS